MSEIFPKLSSNSSHTNSRSRLAEYALGPSYRSNIETDQINESYATVVTSFSIYKLVTEVTKQFRELPAYKAGLIDEKGNFLKAENVLTRKEKEILSPFARLVIGIKRLVGNLSSSKLKAEFGYIQTAAKALAFECKELGGDENLFLEELQKTIDVLCEDGEIGNVVGGGISGGPQVGTANPALAGIDPPLNFSLKKRLLRRKNVIPES